MCGCNKQKNAKKANFPAMPSAMTKTLGKVGRLCRVLWPLHSAKAGRLCRVSQVMHSVKPPCLCRVSPVSHSAKPPFLCRVSQVRHSAKPPCLCRVSHSAKRAGFAECPPSGSRQSDRHRQLALSGNFSLPSGLRALGKAFAECPRSSPRQTQKPSAKRPSPVVAGRLCRVPYW